MADRRPRLRPCAAHALHDARRRRASSPRATRRERGVRDEPPPRRARGRASLPRARRRPRRRLVRGAAEAAPRRCIEWPGKSSVALADELGALGPHVVCVHLTDARPDELELVARRGRPVVFCPRSNLYIETQAAAAARGARGRARSRRSAPTRSRRTRRSTCSPRRARSADRFPTVPARSSCAWRRGRARGRSGATTSGACAKGARPGLVAIDGDPGDDALRLRPWQRAGAAPLDRASRTAAASMTVLARVRTYGSLVAFAHTVFALPFAASAVVLSLARPARAAHGRARLARCSRAWSRARTSAMAFNRWADRDVDAKNPRTRVTPRPRGDGEPRARRSLLAAVSAAAFLAVAATLGFWPAVLAPVVSSRPARLLVREALHLGRARLARRRARAGAGRRVARDGGARRASESSR